MAASPAFSVAAQHGVFPIFFFPSKVGQRAQCLPRLMKLRTAPRLAAVVRTQKQNHGGGDVPQPSCNFIEEKRHIQSLGGEYAFIFDGLLVCDECCWQSI